MSGPKITELLKSDGHRTGALLLAALFLLSLIWVAPFDARAAENYTIVVHKVENLFELNGKDDNDADTEDVVFYDANLSIDQFKKEHQKISLSTGDFSLISVNDELIRQLKPESLGITSPDQAKADATASPETIEQGQKNKIYGEWIPELIDAYLKTKGFDAKLSSEDFTTISGLQATLNELISEQPTTTETSAPAATTTGSETAATTTTATSEVLPPKDQDIAKVLKNSAADLKNLELELEALHFSDTDTIPTYWKRILQEKLLYNLAKKSHELKDGAFAVVSENPTEKEFQYTFSDLAPKNYLIIDRDGFDLIDPQVHALATILLENDFYEDLGNNRVFNTYPKPIFPPEGGKTPPTTHNPGYDLVLTKTDAQGHTLSGAVFYLYYVKKVGNQYKPYKVCQGPENSDAKGRVYFYDLQPGLYSVLEAKAPQGYKDIGWLTFPTLGLEEDKSVIEIKENMAKPLPGITVVNEPEDNPPPGNNNPPPENPPGTPPKTPTPPQGSHTPPGNVPASGGNVPTTGESGMLVGKILSLLLLIASIGLAVQLRRKMRRQETDTDDKH